VKVYRQGELTPDIFNGTVCTIGNFDGMHLGHQKIFKRLSAAKKKYDLPAVACTFEPHPVRLLNPQKGLKLIYSYEQRYELIEQCEPDALVILDFSHELARTPAQDFVKKVLVDLLHIKMIVVGYDFNFGKGGDGNAEALARFGELYGFEVEQVPAVERDGRIVSSSRIRRLIGAGEMEMVRWMLGRPFYLKGSVVEGKKRGGKLLGFPTANLSTQQELIPAKGVYAAIVKTPLGVHKAAVNVGCNPTFNNDGVSIEAHLLKFSQDIYGSDMEIFFIRRIRDEMRFDSIDRLKAQMEIDIEKIRGILHELDPEKTIQ